ncbi:NUDIX hydrolase [Falsibacillus pallidus]|uniref:ADP-ribose pyrophosphatase YjhB (NUDIX family) n=1 Tax=Falsibacillus pallidus TaxID=493781 RepID=A0A370G232_9BACI|nr:NUDIX domain-containing protein [Falsibacillus pallidus]RDI37937.1 ADP-ribose pyrophosphatase YjhB (NUDIX family) [Falsibacillus pallidus]
MIYRRITYKVNPETLEEFNHFFHSYIYPNYLSHGAKLIGRWVNDNRDEVMEVWNYHSMEHYEQVETLIRNSELNKLANEKSVEAGDLYIDRNEDFLSSTATYHVPRHILSVSGYITNDAGDVLLVRNFHRSDTMEMPGGQVEEGETLEEAVHREIFEETGVKVHLLGITGIYQNMTAGVTGVVFRGTYTSGEPRPAENETSEVSFTELTRENIHQYITREQFRSRTLDAMEANYLPYETFKVKPYELLSRYEAKKEYC